MKSLKSALKFWQEIVFVVMIGLPLFGFMIEIILGRIIDKTDIFCFCIGLPILICLIGQFFWKNGTLSMCLAPLLFLYSLFWIFVSFAMPRYIDYDVHNPNNNLRPIIFIGALFLVFAAITMPIKFSSNENSQNVLNTKC